MRVNVFVEPLIVICLLFGGTWINRNKEYRLRLRSARRRSLTIAPDEESLPGSPASFQSRDELLKDEERSPMPRAETISKWRTRKIRFFGYRKTVWTPNTRVFEDRWLSCVIRKFPFLREVLFWALIYWIYQLGRAFTALTLVQGTVHVARLHALQLIYLEQRLHIFCELSIQRFFLSYPWLMTQIDRVYSFIHIPGTILFLAWLYYYTTARRQGYATPQLYEARRRTMATCNLLAFIVFTLWPCMPPRLLSDPNVTGPSGEEARKFGFVDTVHGNGGEGSVWTQNKFCNQYAAMPSLHFGYSVLIGVTVATIPLSEKTRGRDSWRLSPRGIGFTAKTPSWRRVLCTLVGVAYPTIILVAIIATANHFILDAVAGAIVCGFAWKGNRVLLNLLPLEDAFLWCIRTHFPDKGDPEWDVDGIGHSAGADKRNDH